MNQEVCVVCFNSATAATKKCSLCHMSRYCSRKCQIKHWKEYKHKEFCPGIAAKKLIAQGCRPQIPLAMCTHFKDFVCLWCEHIGYGHGYALIDDRSLFQQGDWNLIKKSKNYATTTKDFVKSRCDKTPEAFEDMLTSRYEIFFWSMRFYHQPPYPYREQRNQDLHLITICNKDVLLATRIKRKAIALAAQHIENETRPSVSSFPNIHEKNDL